jgi:hypothetical protein
VVKGAGDRLRSLPGGIPCGSVRHDRRIGITGISDAAARAFDRFRARAGGAGRAGG